MDEVFGEKQFRRLRSRFKKTTWQIHSELSYDPVDSTIFSGMPKNQEALKYRQLVSSQEIWR